MNRKWLLPLIKFVLSIIPLSQFVLFNLIQFHPHLSLAASYYCLGVLLWEVPSRKTEYSKTSSPSSFCSLCGFYLPSVIYFLAQRQRLRTLLQDGHAPALQVPHLGAGHGGVQSLHSHQDHNMATMSPQQPDQEGPNQGRVCTEIKCSYFWDESGLD